MGEPKTLLVKGRSGMGNRMLSAMAGILYASASGRRLLIDWSDFTYSPDGSNVFHRYFRCPSCQDDKIPSTSSVHPAIWVDCLDSSVRDLGEENRQLTSAELRHLSSADLSRLDFDEDLLVSWAHYRGVSWLRPHLDPASRKVPTTEILRGVLEEKLTPRPEIVDRVEQFKSDFFSGSTIGVHVRYSDRLLRLPAIRRVLDAQIRRKPRLQIFLATDNREVKALFEQTYPNVITTPHWFPEPGQRMHQNDACPDRFENGVEALRDLYLLAACDSLVLDTTSTYAFVATVLSSARASAIVDAAPIRGVRPRIRRLAQRQASRLGLAR